MFAGGLVEEVRRVLREQRGLHRFRGRGRGIGRWWRTCRGG